MCLAACHRTKPQTPSNYKQEDDSLQTMLLLLNQQYAENAEQELTKRVKESGEPFVLTPAHIWYLKKEKTDLPPIRKRQNIEYVVNIYTLDSVLLLNERATIDVGQKQTINGIDELLPMLKHQEKVIALVPWYQGYGQLGDDIVPPYTNLMLDLEILN